MSSVFLDTTFTLPLFQEEIIVEGFHSGKFERFISSLPEIHISDLSIYEAKAKLYRLYLKDRSYYKALKNVGENLQVLRSDEQIIFHTYSFEADQRFNSLIAIAPELSAFDAIIASQAVEAGILLTEDEELVSLRESPRFVKSPVFNLLKIKRWRDIS